MGEIKPAGELEIITAPPAIPGGVAGGFRMLISFQGFGHGDSTDFKDWTGFFQKDWILVPIVIGRFFQCSDSYRN